MDKFKNLSGLTKANLGALLLFSIIAFLGHVWIWKLYFLAPYGFALLVGQSLTTALNDPEADEPIPLWMRAAVGYTVGILFGLGLVLVQMFITSHLRWMSGT